MTNDTAMTKQESEVMIEQLKKVFEVVRLLDVDTLEMGNLKGVEDVDGKKVHVVRTVHPEKHYRKKKKY